MLELERKTGESRLNFIEMATVVQVTSPDDDLTVIAEKVLALRERRASSTLNKKKFDREELEATARAFSSRMGSLTRYRHLTTMQTQILVIQRQRGLCKARGVVSR